MKKIDFNDLDLRIINNFKKLNVERSNGKDYFGNLIIDKNNKFLLFKSDKDFFAVFQSQIKTNEDLSIDYEELMNVVKSIRSLDFHLLKYKDKTWIKANPKLEKETVTFEIERPLEQFKLPNINRKKKDHSFILRNNFFDEIKRLKTKYGKYLPLENNFIRCKDNQFSFESYEEKGQYGGLESIPFFFKGESNRNFEINFDRTLTDFLIKLLKSDYEVSIYEKKYVVFKNLYVPLEYIFNLENSLTSRIKVEPKPTTDTKKVRNRYA